MKESKEERWARFLERLAEEARQVGEVKDRVAKSYGLKRDAKFDRVWAIAWDHGHAYGLAEVESYFSDLVDLIKPDAGVVR